MDNKSCYKKMFGGILIVVSSIVICISVHVAPLFAAPAYIADKPGQIVTVAEPLFIASNDSIGLDARNGGTITSSFDIGVSGDKSYGAYAKDSSAIIIDKSITTSGDLSTTMRVENGSTAHVEGDISMYGNGVYDKILGYRSFGLYADGSEVTVGGSVTTSGDFSTALYAKDSAITIYGGVSSTGKGNEDATQGRGAHAVNSVNSTVNVSSDIIAKGDYNWGVNASSDSFVTVDGKISVNGLGVQGVNSEYGSVVTVSGDITATGGNTHGINASKEATVNALGNVTALDDHFIAYGIHAVSKGNVNVSGDITSKAKEQAFGINALDNGTVVTVDGDVTVESGKYVRGILAEKSEVNVGGSVYAKGAPDVGYTFGEAVYALDSGRIDVYGDVIAEGKFMMGADAGLFSSVKIGGDITVMGDETWGIYSWTNASVDVSGSVTATGENTRGAYAYSSSFVGVSKDVTAIGKNARGLYLYTDSNADVGGNVVVSGDNSYGAYVYNNSAISVDGKVAVSGENTYGLYIYTARASIGDGVTATGTSAIGVYTLGSRSVVDVTGDINVTGANSYGVYATGNSVVTVKDSVMNSSGENSRLIRVENSVVSLDNVTGINDGHALLYTTSSGNVFAENGSNLLGDVINANTANAGAVLNFTLDGNSTLKGTINDSGSRAKTNVKLSGKNDIWYVTDTSTIKGSLDNDGIVDYSYSPSFTNVTVGDLGAKGGTGGTYIMKADVENEIADNLIVTGDTLGSYKIFVANDGGGNTDGSELTTLVQTADQEGFFELRNEVEVGAWKYGLRQICYESGNAIWELFAKGTSGPGTDVVNSISASYLLGYAHMETLIKRLGDLRETPDADGVWARLHGGKFESGKRGHAEPFDMKYWGVHIGYDKKLEYEGWKGDTYAGIFFGWGKGDVDYFANGDGDLESKEIGIYGTWIHPNGFFADLVFKYQWIDNKFTAIDSAGDYVKGSGLTTGGFGGSLELGQRVHFAVREESDPRVGWYIEPQVQLSIMRYKGDSFNISNGMIAGTGGFTSIIGRLGALVGYENASKTSNFYLKAFRLREFEGDVHAYINGKRYSTPYKGSWWVYGLGYTGKINDRNSIYFDIERTSDAKFKQVWSARFGWRYAF